MENTVIDQIKDLEERKQKLIDEARDDAMTKAKEAIAILKELGIHYQIVAKHSKRAQRPARRKPASEKKPAQQTVIPQAPNSFEQLKT